MPAEIIDFPSNKMTADVLLKSARKMGFKDVVVIGIDTNDIFTYGYSEMDRSKAYTMMQRASKDLLLEFDHT